MTGVEGPRKISLHMSMVRKYRVKIGIICDIDPIIP